MPLSHIISAALLAAGASTPVADKLFDATDPVAVAAALMTAGYKAELKTDDGDPYILSAANGESFTIDFSDCKDKHCSSFQFDSYYQAEPLFTAAFANQWNLENRFLKVAVDEKGQLREYLYASGVGKLTQANFADLVDWYQTMDGALAKFVKEKREAAKPAAKAK